VDLRGQAEIPPSPRHPDSHDPIQAACQRNYTLLTTDGFWNNLSSSPPKTPAGATIGNLDSTPSTLLGNALVDRAHQRRPLDGTGSSSTTFTPVERTRAGALPGQQHGELFRRSAAQQPAAARRTQHAVIQQA